MVGLANSAADHLSQEGIEVELVDIGSLVPLDTDTMVQSVKKTRLARVIDESSRQFGAAGEIAASLAEEAFDWLGAPVLRLAAANVPMPFGRDLEALVQPDEQRIVQNVHELVGRLR